MSTRYSLRSLVGTIPAHAVPVVAFKNCCMRSGQFDGVDRDPLLLGNDPESPTPGLGPDPADAGTLLAPRRCGNPVNFVSLGHMLKRTMRNYFLALRASARFGRAAKLQGAGETTRCCSGCSRSVARSAPIGAASSSSRRTFFKRATAWFEFAAGKFFAHIEDAELVIQVANREPPILPESLAGIFDPSGATLRCTRHARCGLIARTMAVAVAKRKR